MDAASGDIHPLYFDDPRDDGYHLSNNIISIHEDRRGNCGSALASG